MKNSLPRAPAHLADEKQTDWFRVITDLNRSGWTNEIIAKELGTGRTTIIGWRDGAEPKYYDGKRLLDLWNVVVFSSRPQLDPGSFKGNHSYADKRRK